jgi:endonuclease G
MCPAEAMSFNLDAMSESFFFSNMSPQSGSLNRGKWKSLETKVRKWAKYKGEIHVVSGPIFKNNISVIGGNGVTVPGYYFKIIYNPENGMIAFVFPNEKANNSLDKYIVTVDWVEDMTGIDFFETMNDEDEALIEAKSDPSLWGLTGLVIMNAPVTVDNDDRCKAITKKGERCKRKRKEESDYCWQHNK